MDGLRRDLTRVDGLIAEELGLSPPLTRGAGQRALRHALRLLVDVVDEDVLAEVLRLHVERPPAVDA